MDKTPIILYGTPLSTGHIYKSHCRFGHPCVYMSADGKKLKEDYQIQAKSQWRKPMLSGEVSLNIKIYRAKNIGDIDNFNKIVLDSLSGIIWEDDKQIVKLEIEKYTDKNNPRMEINIWQEEK